MHSQFYIGVVEARDDTIEIGRYRVRVFGVHSESLDDVPTDALPWAIALNTTPSVSGLGTRATYVEGSTVFVFFQDGDSKQQPIILGAFHGVPKSQAPLGVVTETIVESAPVTSDTGIPVTDTQGVPVQTEILDTNKLLKDALGKKESGNNYKAVNQLGYLGKYQMGAAMLCDLGYVKKGTSNSALAIPASWTGKNGISSKESFLNSSEVQESAMDSELAMNENRLKKLGVIDDSTTAQEKAGFLATSHLLGTGGARDMKNGIVKSDANGVTGNTYYSLGYKSVSGSEPVVSPQATSVDNPEREKSIIHNVGYTTKTIQTDKTGFSDPNKKYPRYIKEQDTNRLERNQNIVGTIVSIKEMSEDRNVPIANGKGTWSQSQTPYNALYPYNVVSESESGHIVEFDDTEGNERINIHHRMGTFIEIDRNGTMVRKIVGDNYEILERNGYVHIKGTVNITVDGNANIKVGNTCELDVGGDLNASIGGSAKWTVGGDWLVKSAGNAHISAGGTAAIDATKVYWNTGVSTAGNLPNPSSTAAGVIDFPALVLPHRGFNKLSDFEEEVSVSEATENSARLAEEGLIDPNADAGTVSEESLMPEKSAAENTPVECSMFVSGQINIKDFISPNFRLSDLTGGKGIPVSQAGKKDTELACNLKQLAVNVLEPIKRKYPDMIITSGLRVPGNNSKSQHPLGMAADIQFTAHSKADYVKIAADIYSSVAIDQCILEYRTKASHSPVWIHVSFSPDGNRKQCFTMDNDVRISEFGQFKQVT